MGELQLNEPLPYTWRDLETSRNDQRWLGGIIRNAAPFSDWWTKTRVVQLAYQAMYEANPQVYLGLTSVEAIVKALYQELEVHCNAQELSECQKYYPGFFNTVDEEFVITTLNSWKDKEFTQAIGRNFEVYSYNDHAKLSRQDCKTFLVVSTASVSLSVERRLPPLKLFRPLFNVDELAHVIHATNPECITLRTHGYANPAKGFFEFFAKEADQLFSGEVNTETAPNPEVATESQSRPPTTLSHRHLYIGYHWPSEQPIINGGLIKDLIRNWGIFLKFLGSMLVLSIIPGLALAGLYDLILPLQTRWYWVIPLVVFITWLLAFGLLRALVYQRDRYRAVHYGAPDLAEFFWRLDKRLQELQVAAQKAKIAVNPEAELVVADRKRVHLVGHSMGGLVLVNTLRVLSDRFGKDDRIAQQRGSMGECLDLGKLILASPDIPLELLREGRNNYVRSAIRRCEQIYLMSSDRDIVLRYLSTLGNWFSEPSIEMSGLRLGNVYLHRGRHIREMLLIRSAILSRPAVRPTSAYDLFESFNYLDCSRMNGVNAIGLPLTLATALPIDIANVLFYLLGKIDVHGGYFRTYTPTFKLLPFLLQTIAPTEQDVRQELERLDTKQQIRFLPSRPVKSTSADDHF